MKHTDEFRAKVVAKFKEAKKRGTPTIAELGKQLDISVGQIYDWVKNAGKKKKTARGDYTIQKKRKAIELVGSGMTQAEVARKLDIEPASISYWMKHGIGDGEPPPQRTPRPTTNGSAAGEIKDALIFLRHAEKEIMEMLAKGKITRLDPAHLLTLQALATLQKGINK